MADVQTLRDAGFTEGEIQSHFATQVEELSAAGFTQEEIAKHIGTRVVDTGAAQKNLATNVYDAMVNTAKRVGKTYVGIGETAVSVTSGLAAGFPAYLMGGIGGLIARHTYSPDTDPKEVATLFSNAVTYDPRSDNGKQFTDVVTYPFQMLSTFKEKMGKAVADKTGSPTLAAITDETIGMLPFVLLGGLVRTLKGKVPTESDMYLAAKELAPDAPPAVVNELSKKTQTAYEKSGIDPETMRDAAREDATVLQNLASDNRDVPHGTGGAPPEPPGMPPRAAETPPEPPAPGTPEAAQKAVLDRVSVGEQTKNAVTLDEVYTAVKDDLYPIAQIEKALVDGATLATAESPYKLARLTRGSAGKADQFLDYGAFDWNTYENVGHGLKKILEPHHKDLDGFRAYAVAKRAEELHQRGIATGVPLEDAVKVTAAGAKYAEAFKQMGEYQNNLVKYLRDSGLISKEAFNAMLEANKDYVPFHRVIEGGQGGAGAGMRTRNPIRAIKGSERIIVDPLESIIKNTYLYTALAERNAVGTAFGRLVADNPAAAADLGISKVQTTFRPVTLSEVEIRKLFDAFVKTSRRSKTERSETSKTETTGTDGSSVSPEPTNKIYVANKQRVTDALKARGFSDGESEIMMRRLRIGADAKESVGSTNTTTEKIIKEVTTTEYVAELNTRMPSDAAMIFRANAMRPEQNQIRYFEDGKPITLEVPQAVADAFTAADRQSAGMLLKILSVPASTLRAGAVLAPDFMLRNVMRDQLSAFTFSKNGYIPVWDMVQGMMEIGKKGEVFQDWLKSGAANAAMVAIDRQYLQQHLLELDKSAGLMTRAWNVAKTPLEVLRIASELAENATRVGDFRRAQAEGKAGIQEAGFNSREVTLDFQRIGAQTRGLNMISAFMNAGLEGMDRTVRAFKDDPIGTTAKVTAAVTVPSVLLWWANHDDPRWKEIPQWQRDLFWIVMTEDHIFRIPKPFEVGVIFGSLPERMLDKFVDEQPDAFKNFARTMGQAFGINLFPTFAAAPLEQVTNHSFFTGNPLIPSRMEGILPEYQYNEYTSELTKAIGGMIGAFPGLKEKSIASPIVIDNYIRGWTGTLGAYVRDTLDYGLRKAGVLPDPVLPIATLADIPVVKAFAVRYPAATAQSVQDFYEDYGKRKTVYDTFQYLVKNGDPDAAIKESELEPGAFAKMDGIAESIGALNGYIRMVYKNPDMTPSDKRQIIDTMYGQMIEMSRAGNDAIREVDKVLGKD